MATIEEYVEQLKHTIEWGHVVTSARQDVSDKECGRYFLGSILSLTPSGKYYMPWCTNYTQAEVEEDERWYIALEMIALALGGWIEFGEGDPLDLFFVTDLELEV